MKTTTACLITLLICPITNAGNVSEKSDNSESNLLTPPTGIPIELYLAFFRSRTEVSNTTVRATSQCFLCAPTTVSKNVDSWNGDVGGIRMGIWGDKPGMNLGFAFEMNHTNASASDVKASYNVFSLSPGIRYSLPRLSSLPNNATHLYLGVSISRLIDGQVSVNFPELPSSVKVSNGLEGAGRGGFIGASIGYKNFTLFAEARSMNMELSGKYLGDSINMTVATKEILIGGAYRIKTH